MCLCGQRSLVLTSLWQIGKTRLNTEYPHQSLDFIHPDDLDTKGIPVLPCVISLEKAGL